MMSSSCLFSLHFPVCQSSLALDWQTDTLSVLDVEMGHTSLCVLGLLCEYSSEFTLFSLSESLKKLFDAWNFRDYNFNL